MIIVDTNIVSEWMKVSPDTAVLNWLNAQETAHLFITSITIAEISYGLNNMPVGHRRDKLEKSFQLALREAFQYRILFFDEEAAYAYGKLMGHRKQLGRPLSILDGQIAAIAQSNKMSLATRNINDFCECHIELINPFQFQK